MNATARCLLACAVLTVGCATPNTNEHAARSQSETGAGSRTANAKSPATGDAVSASSASLKKSHEVEAGDRAATDGAAESKKRQPQATTSLDELLLFYPTKFPDGDWESRGLTFEDVWFTAADGTRIHGWYCPCENPRALVLFCHGNAGNLSHRRPLLAYMQNDLRASVLIFDYRGYGRSEGTPSVDGILMDARAARSFLAEHAGVKESDIVLMGRSLGGAVAVHLASEEPPRGLILESTFSSFRDIAAEHYPALAWLVPRKKLDSASAIAQYRGPLLLSHGDADRTVPYALGEKLFDAAHEPKQFVRVAGGDHNDPQPSEYYQQLDQFIGNLPNR